MESYLISIVLVASVLAGVLASEGGSAWSYNREDASNGPDMWSHKFPECSGARNSPIDIELGKTMDKQAHAWKLEGWNMPSKWEIHDEHYAIKMSLSNDDVIMTNGGDLVNTYKLLQFHFHWGGSNNHGSEHTIDGKAYPMEMHFVHMKADHASLNDAVASLEDDALAAVGFFFQIQDEDNQALKPIIDAVEEVRAHVNRSVSDIRLQSLTSFVQKSMEGNFFRYYGGLTTPGCNELVKWTLFQTPIGISARQMEVFRNQEHDAAAYGTEFYRDVQNIGRRTVVKYDVDYSAASSNAAVYSFTLLALFIVKFV